MYKLEEFKQLVRDFSQVADFLVVYVAEAHSTGEPQEAQFPAAFTLFTRNKRDTLLHCGSFATSDS